VLAADFSSTTGRWTVTAQHGDETVFSVEVLFSGTATTDYAAGHTPDFAGIRGLHRHRRAPQHWPEDLDYTGKKVVVMAAGPPP